MGSGVTGPLLRDHPGRMVVAKANVDWGSPRALYSEGTLVRQLKLKEVHTRVTWGALHRACPGRADRIEVGTSWRFAVCSVQGAAWLLS